MTKEELEIQRALGLTGIYYVSICSPLYKPIAYPLGPALSGFEDVRIESVNIEEDAEKLKQKAGQQFKVDPNDLYVVILPTDVNRKDIL